MSISDPWMTWNGKNCKAPNSKVAFSMFIKKETHKELELLRFFSLDLCLEDVWRSPSLQRTELAKVALHKLVQILPQHERCQIQFEPKMGGYHRAGYMLSHQHSKHQPQYCRLDVRLQVPHNKHFQQCHKAFHLERIYAKTIILSLMYEYSYQTRIHDNQSRKIPGVTNSDKPKSMAFSGEFSSLDVNKKFWSIIQ